jgi:hypothetical protein
MTTPPLPQSALPLTSVPPTASAAPSLVRPPPEIALGSPEGGTPPPLRPTKAWEGLRKVQTPQFEKSLYVCASSLFAMYIRPILIKGWKSTNTGWEAMEEEDYGQFYSNRCYVYHEILTPEVLYIFLLLNFVLIFVLVWKMPISGFLLARYNCSQSFLD